MLPTLPELIKKGALFVVNHSGGKDSQAMLLKLKGMVPDNQLCIVHAHLPGMDWEGIAEHILDTNMGITTHFVQARKTFFEMVQHRQKFPGMSTRQCTSDLKRGPIEKIVRYLSKQHGRSIIVNCMGIRAEESTNRSKQTVFKFSSRNSKAGRTWYEWLPIFNYDEAQVFDAISMAGQKPHWVYLKGMRRCSCKVCIFSTRQDIKTAAQLDPGFIAELSALERQIGFSMIQPKKGEQPKYLDQIILE